MRTDKTILFEEAARSVRRSFIGSLAGTFSMLVVIGGVGAYGMPERAIARSLSVALASWQTKVSPMIERAVPAVERTMTLVGDVTRREAAAMPAPENPDAQPAPPLVPPAIAPHPSPAVAPQYTEIAIAPPIASVEEPPVAETAPAVAVSAMPIALSQPTDERTGAIAPQAMQAPPVADAPKVVAALTTPEMSTLSEMPQTSAAPQTSEPRRRPETPAPVEPASQTEDVPNTIAAPRTVLMQLPLPKPPLTPAQRLDLHGKDYDKAERCLAQAVYFEARNEAARGQMAVAQVVMNRVFSPYYPKDVCSVVYQNAHRHLSCQFTFACDGKPEAIRERGAWARAQRIARQTLDAKVWLPEVAKATHYHAAYVHPYWVRDMKVMVRYGLHTFYRPRNWGDGANEPSWGAAAAKKGRSS